VIDWLFAKLLTAFGSSWGQTFEGVPMELVKQDWRHVLGRYSPEAVVLAFDLMFRERLRFPPNLTEFNALCRDARRLIADAPQLQLPAPRLDPPAGTWQRLGYVLQGRFVPRQRGGT
jgi:hypothetical protein